MLDCLILAELREENPATVRHVFYRLCHHELVGKDESGYRRVQRRVLELRKKGQLPYHWISDGTRFRIKPATHASLEEALHETALYYRRALWHDAKVYVEVWCESDSIAGVLEPITDKYDVSLMPSRGFSSHTFLYRAAREIEDIDRPTFIYYIGDWDPSGALIADNIEERLREFAPRINIEFERLLINPDQIDKFDLPTKPVKRTTHSHRFDDHRAVEAEAMSAGQTREILENAILRHIDQRELEVLEIAEAEEKKVLRMFERDVASGHASL